MAAATIAHLRQRRVQETVDRYRRKLPVIPGGRLDCGVPLAYLGRLVGREERHHGADSGRPPRPHLVVEPVPAPRPGGDGQGPPIVQACVRWGAGPRAGQALVLAGKARAVLDGRPAVSLDDIRQVAAPVLRHRILVNFQAEADGIDAAAVVAQVLDHVPSPA